MEELYFDDAQDVIDKGYDGKWFKASEVDTRRIIRSIAAVNLLRATQGQHFLDHYQDRGLLVITSNLYGVKPLDPEPVVALSYTDANEKAQLTAGISAASSTEVLP